MTSLWSSPLTPLRFYLSSTSDAHPRGSAFCARTLRTAQARTALHAAVNPERAPPQGPQNRSKSARWSRPERSAPHMKAREKKKGAFLRQEKKPALERATPHIKAREKKKKGALVREEKKMPALDAEGENAQA